MEFNPQRTNEARTLGDFAALAAAAHVAPEALEQLLTAGLLAPVHRLPTGDLFDLHPNRLQTIREQLAETRTKPPNEIESDTHVLLRHPKPPVRANRD